MLHPYHKGKEDDRMGGGQHGRHPAPPFLRLRLCRNRGYTKIYVGSSPLFEGSQHEFPSFRTEQEIRVYQSINHRGRTDGRITGTKVCRGTDFGCCSYYEVSDQSTRKLVDRPTLSCRQPSHGGSDKVGKKPNDASSQQNARNIDFVAT
jgi:hypothetical protein